MVQYAKKSGRPIGNRVYYGMLLILSALYILGSLLIIMIGLHAYFSCYLLQRQINNLPFPQPNQDPDWPEVLLQLPVYNELNSVEGLLHSVCQLDYPAHLLKIQILDDSQDETTGFIQHLLTKMDIEFEVNHLKRSSRDGFKAGALSFGMNMEPNSPYLAILDADFRPEPNFIKQAIYPMLQDPEVGLVQARWSYRNESESIFHKFQALGMDGHFAVEQPARSLNGLAMNFNGTAGIFRRQCILDGGNWSGDTLTEDLDLSYRIQLCSGWKFLFLKDLHCPSEIPSSVSSLQTQQFRWAKGSIQVAKKLLPGVLRSSWSFLKKIEACFHLTHYMIHPLILFHYICGCFLSFLGVFSGFQDYQYLGIPLLLSCTGPSFLYHYSQKTLKKPTPPILLYPLMIGLGCAMSLNNTKAVFEALTNRTSPFQRTPKTGERSQKNYENEFRFQIPGELLLSIPGILSLYLASNSMSLFHFFLALNSFGFLCFGLSLFFEKASFCSKSDLYKTTGVQFQATSLASPR